VGDAHDVVVVGAGAAGCVIGARLAEAGSSVLLVEAGPDRRGAVAPALRDGWRLPAGADWDVDWGFRSEPDADGETTPLRRGRLVGGTSWLTRFAVRGSLDDLEAWDVDGWTPEDLLPAFVRLENDLDHPDQPWHGDAGPIPIGRALDVPATPALAAIGAAMERSGFPPVDDHNAPGAVGVGRMPMSVRDGLRATTADAYLAPERVPSTLTVLPDRTVDAVILDDDRASGVRLADGSVIEAGRVVLSAGVYGSPPILLRSGIGPADELRELGVTVRVPLDGVGRNLRDHPGVEVAPAYHGPGRDAPLLHTIATFHSDGARADGPPDLLLWTSDPSGDPPELGIAAVLMKPRGGGTVRLRSADPSDAPRIDLPPLDDTDVDRLLEACRRAHEVVSDPAVRAGCGDPPPAFGNDDASRARVRAEAYSLPHVVGTCAMGRSPEAGAVVDADGRVHGTDGLHVIDASIVPEPPSGFPHLWAIAVAERLSHVLSGRRT